MAEDWDNLIILDACRYDLFEKRNPIEGELQKRISAGSHTVEFLEHNFSGGSFRSTVYITGTPQLSKTGVENNFYEMVPTWKLDWGPNQRTVPPECQSRRTVDCIKKHPNKRIISHFVQPHYPFIGPIGQDLEEEVSAKTGLEAKELDEMNIWDYARKGIIDVDKLRAAYEENLDVLLPHIEDLVEQLPGKTVVTSDHGNAFGEWGLLGHPGRKYIESLVCIPWLVVDGERRTITEGKTRGNQSVITEGVDQRLADLGYL